MEDHDAPIDKNFETLYSFFRGDQNKYVFSWSDAQVTRSGSLTKYESCLESRQQWRLQ